MRASIVVSSFLVADALEKPIHHHNAGEDAIVWKTVTVYATNIASGNIPSVTVSEAIESAKFVTEPAIVVQPHKLPQRPFPNSARYIPLLLTHFCYQKHPPTQQGLFLRSRYPLHTSSHRHS